MNIFLTGATGLVGGELLVELSRRKDITKIYCLVRAADALSGTERLKKIFALRNDPFDPHKIIAIPGDLRDQSLTEKLISLKELQTVDVVIHSAANTSFSRIYNVMVEEINIHGLYKILQWAKQLPNLSTFLYIGTATICGKNVTNTVIYEDQSPDINSSHVVRYTYTKMQGELLLRNELPGEKILIARPSIIMGDSRPITPRSPVILWALATINALRLCPFNEHAKLDIISADFAAAAIINLLFAKRRQYEVYHVSAGIDAHTTAAQTLSTLEPFYTDLPAYKFIHKSALKQIKFWSKGIQWEEASLLNEKQYLLHWEDAFEDRKNLRVILAGLEPYIEFIELEHVFDNSRLLADTGMTPPQPAHEYIVHSIPYLKSINILEGAFDS